MVADPVPHVRRAAHAYATAAPRSSPDTLPTCSTASTATCCTTSATSSTTTRPSALRNDLGLLFLVELDQLGPRRLEAIPLALDFCRTRLATGDDAARIVDRFRQACSAFDTAVNVEDDRLVVSWR